MDNRAIQQADTLPRLISGILLLLIVLLACGLRFYYLDMQSLWNDEGTSVAVAQRDLATITRDAAADIHPPLYYWLLSGWVRLFGTSEFAVRALSAFLGVILVALTYSLGRLLAGRWAGQAAAFLAAINPFQIYYSQEARMYMLLAALTALTFYAALRWAVAGPGKGMLHWGIVYVLAGAAGLYTHYTFALVLLAVNLCLLLFIGLRWNAQQWQWQLRPWWWWLLRWIALQAVVALLFLPWLPTAFRQLTTWPRVDQPVDLVAAVTAIGQLLLVGPAAPPLRENVVLLLFLAVVFVPSRGGNRLPRLVAGLVPVLWLVVPVALILGLGLIKEAYLKFLLVVSPAFCLLVGRLVTAPLRGERVIRSLSAVLCAFLALFLLYASAVGLDSYYHDPTFSRDDYRGIAAYIQAVEQPGDVVLLNAPGQQEVFGYYYQGEPSGNLPLYPLPQSRPLDRAATESALAEMIQPGARVFAVLWATDESDPQRFIEGWLDTNAYKALDSWHGNVRLVVYAVPEQTPDTPDHTLDVHLQNAATGDEITLLGYSLLGDRLAAGDIAQLTLFWQAEQTPAVRYKAFVHVLDEGNHIVGQRDAEPGGGAHLTTLWQPGEVVADNYGITLHPATPPGEYRIEVGMYDVETGQRLTTASGEGQVWLEPLAIERPSAPVPVAALGMQNVEGAEFGELTLLGYDAYKLGFAHQPDAPLRPGDVLHVNLYWRAEVQSTAVWPIEITLVDSDGQAWASIESEPVGNYPVREWRAGDVWRGQFNLVVPTDAPPARYQLRVTPAAVSDTAPESFFSKPLIVVP